MIRWLLRKLFRPAPRFTSRELRVHDPVWWEQHRKSSVPAALNAFTCRHGDHDLTRIFAEREDRHIALGNKRLASHSKP